MKKAGVWLICISLIVCLCFPSNTLSASNTYINDNDGTAVEIKAKHTSKNPFYGKASDYTKKQSTTKGSLKSDEKIRSLTVIAIALLCSGVTGGLSFSDVASAILTYAVSTNSNTKNLYYTRVKYGHKTMPGIYHKYVTTWYLNSARTKKVGKKAVHYDATQ